MILLLKLFCLKMDIKMQKEIEKDAEEKVEIHEFGGNIKIKSRDQKIKIAIIGEKARGKISITW